MSSSKLVCTGWGRLGQLWSASSPRDWAEVTRDWIQSLQNWPQKVSAWKRFLYYLVQSLVILKNIFFLIKKERGSEVCGLSPQPANDRTGIRTQVCWHHGIKFKVKVKLSVREAPSQSPLSVGASWGRVAYPRSPCWTVPHLSLRPVLPIDPCRRGKVGGNQRRRWKRGRAGEGWGRGTERGKRRECLTLDRITLMELVPQES